MPNYVPGVGPLEPKLMIIGESPGRHENESGIPFVGPTGQLLDAALFKAGISRHECYITNVSKYQPPLNDFDKLSVIGVDINEQIQSLWDNEIKLLKPNCILAIGDRALQAVTDYSGILNYRGSILMARDAKTKVVATIHPAALLPKNKYGDENEHGGKSGALPWTYMKLIEHDIIRAYEESHSRTLNLPHRDLTIAHNSLDVFRFFREYENLDKVYIDIESINCVPVCIGFAFNKYHAMSIPLVRSIGNIQFTDMGYNELIEIYRIIDGVLRTKKLVGQNLAYDHYKLSLVGFLLRHVYSDTLIKTRVLFPELPVKKLHVQSSIWTREPYYKEEGKEFRPGKDKPERLLLYNGKDCAVGMEIDEVQDIDLDDLALRYNLPMRDYYYNYQMKKHDFYLSMAQNGFKVDFARQSELKKKYKQLEIEVHKRITEAVGGELNVKSPKQKGQLLYDIMNFKKPKRNPTAEETIVGLINNHCKGAKTKFRPVLEDILEESRIRDQKSRYINFRPDYDGRCKSTFNVIATETTRTSTGVLKAPLRPKGEKIGLSFHTISKHGRLAKDIRSMFICDPGMVMIQIDSSGAEARVVAVLCEDWTLLKAFDTVDIHRRTAGLILQFVKELHLEEDFKNDIIDNLDKDSPERFMGKKVRHAGNYDMKKHEFMINVNTDAQKFGIKLDVSEWKAGMMLDLFHHASPLIRNKFHTDIKDCIDSSKVLIDPFGGPRIFNGKLEDATYREGYANIPQRTIGHLVQGAALKIEEELNRDLPKSYMWMSENHDSLTLQAPVNNWIVYAKLMQKHLQRPIDFSTYCSLKRDYKLIIPAEVEVSETHYGDFKKVKI